MKFAQFYPRSGYSNSLVGKFRKEFVISSIGLILRYIGILPETPLTKNLDKQVGNKISAGQLLQNNRRPLHHHNYHPSSQTSWKYFLKICLKILKKYLKVRSGAATDRMKSSTLIKNIITTCNRISGQP